MGSKLLLADDSVTIQKVVELTLADEDYEITMVSDGASALQKAEEIHPDLILADIVMPELNGYELCEKVRQSPVLAQTPVLLLSSTFETYDEARGTGAGANDHIIKPFESEELTRKIKDLLEQKPSVEETVAGTETAGAVLAGAAAAAVAPEETVMDGQAVVEEAEFEFELTDEFMDQAEEMFEETDEAMADVAESDTLPELEELSAENALGSFDGLMSGEELEPISQGLAEESREEEIRGPAEPSATLDDFAAPADQEVPADWVTYESDEIDREIMEEEDVKLYEIPEELAEPQDLAVSGATSGEEDIFQVESSPADLIDEFMAADEITEISDLAGEETQDLTEEEIVGAVQEPVIPESEPYLPEQIEPTWSGAPEEPAAETTLSAEEHETETVPDETLAWAASAGTVDSGLAGVTEQTSEAPVSATETAAEPQTVSEETVRRIVSEIVEEKAAEIIERVAWEVIPDLAEMLIQKEIQRIQQEVESA
jgi:DNA-binding response OmpR family regulator